MAGEPNPGRAEAMVSVEMSERTAYCLRYMLPIIAEAVTGNPGDQAAETKEMLEQAIADVHAALPAGLQACVEEREIAEWRMDVIDKQRDAGVRPAKEQP